VSISSGNGTFRVGQKFYIFPFKITKFTHQVIVALFILSGFYIQKISQTYILGFLLHIFEFISTIVVIKRAGQIFDTNDSNSNYTSSTLEGVKIKILIR